MGYIQIINYILLNEEMLITFGSKRSSIKIKRIYFEKIDALSK